MQTSRAEMCINYTRLASLRSFSILLTANLDISQCNAFLHFRKITFFTLGMTILLMVVLHVVVRRLQSNVLPTSMSKLVQTRLLSSNGDRHGTRSWVHRGFCIHLCKSTYGRASYLLLTRRVGSGCGFPCKQMSMARLRKLFRIISIYAMCMFNTRVIN